MRKSLAVVGLACAVGGCLWERDLGERPARLQLGFNTRHVAMEKPKPQLGPIARSTSTSTTTTTPPVEAPPDEVTSTGITGSAQFTMGYRHGIYMGGEVEAGPMSRQGSFFGGAYGVVGSEIANDRGALSVEMIAGRRWLRYELGADDVASLALEPRVRGQIWLGPQVTLGGVVGANAVPGEVGWMAGIYLGVYSNDKNGAK